MGIAMESDIHLREVGIEFTNKLSYVSAVSAC